MFDAFDAAVGPVVKQLWTQAGESIRRHEFDRALRCLKGAALVDRTPLSHICLAEFLARRGESELALEAAHQAWEQAKRLASPPFRAQACRTIAELHRRWGNGLAARQFQQLAIAAELESPDHAVSDGSLQGCGYDALVAEGPEAAALWLAAVRTSGLLAETQCVFGQAHLQGGRLDAAWEALVCAWTHFIRRRDEEGLVRCLVGMGDVLQRQGEWDLACQYYRSALKGVERLQAPHLAAVIRRRCDVLERALGWLASDPSWN